VAPREFLGSRREAGRLGIVGRSRVSGCNAAESACPGTDFPQDEDGRRSLPPALPDVGASRFPAHGNQAVFPENLSHAGNHFPGRSANLEPGWAFPGKRAAHENPLRWRAHDSATRSRTSSIGTAFPVTSSNEVASRPFSPQRWIRPKYDRSVVTFRAKPW